MPEKKRQRSFIENYLIAGAMVAVKQTIVAPVERVKLVKQAEAELLKIDAISKPYKNIIDCGMKLYKTEGIISFWRGNMANCIRFFPSLIMSFTIHDQIKRVFRQYESDPYSVNFLKNVTSGGVAGTLTHSITYPLDYVRTRLANDVKSVKKGVSERQFTGFIDVFRKTLAKDGPSGLYRGFVVSSIGIFVYRGFFFGIYDALKPLRNVPDLNIIDYYLIAYGSNVVAMIISYPIDTVQRRMMMTSCETVKYNGSLDCISQILRKEGFKAFYKGFDASIIRVVTMVWVLPVCDKIIQYYLDT